MDKTTKHLNAYWEGDHCEKCLNAHFPQKPPKMDYINLFYAWEKESYLLTITKDTAICVHNKAHKYS